MMQSFTAIRQQNALKIAQMARQALIRSKPTKQQLAKDLTARTKRAAREMLSFWKRNEKEERELRKKAEKEKMESRKREEEMREAQRQARKLNFLITQTELYSHFVGKKLGVADDDASADAKIPEPAAQAEPFRDIDFDTEDDEQLKARAAVQAQAALAKQQEAARQFDTKTNSNIQLTETTVDQMNFLNPTSFKSGPEVEQPSMLTVTLKSYQAKGLNWLAGLWEQGINGILADEMGLGKTIQSISLMAHLAETHNLWGPFLVVSPASTLPNWQQEIARFTPQLKVLPYWGDADDRKTLRKLLNPKKLGLVDSPFHVAVTSYQLIVSDYQYFGRIKWQYMILDEAQAIKSSSSQRWKTLLKLPTRNRLLLTGTPIQNSMQELWSLLHFIMPTLFDSHEEFNEWFSKDIESHVESGGEGKGLNEEQLRRLHMILKPFMLRRVKRDVENELAEKIEIELPCTLTWRQRELYRRLKSKISVRELLDGLGSSSSVNTNTANGNADIWGDDDGGDTLMNLVMQFRKVCNHPELFERSTIKGPFYALPVELMDAYGGARTSLADAGWSMIRYRVPTLIWNTAWNVSRIRWHGVKILSNPANVSEDLYASLRRSRSQPADAKSRTTSTFDFLALCDTSPSEFAFLSDADLLERWVHHLLTREALWRLQEYFARNDLETPARHTLSLSRRPLQVYIPGLPDIWSFTTEEEPHHILSRLEVASTESAVASPVEAVCSSRSFLTEQQWLRYNTCVRALLYHQAIYLLSVSRTDRRAYDYITSHTPDTLPVEAGLLGKPTRPGVGWGFLTVPSVERLVVDSGKMLVLDKLLATLKAGGHRVLIFFQMTLMMDLMEEYLASRQYGYLRLDGSTSILDRRDLVTDWQTRPEIFVFILSTRAGGLGINLTAADTVIFYDSDWNPTVDQQAMDRSHRLGQTKQVTVYRLITTGTIEERIVQRARQKDQIQKVVISGGEFKQQVEFKPKEVLSLLLDDEEMAEKVRKESALRRAEEEQKQKVKAAKAAATKARKNVGGARSKQGTPRASGSPAPSVGGPSRKTTITARSSLSTTSGLPGTPLSNTDSPSVAAPTSGSAAGMGAGPSQ
ncbi:SNF2 family N-terminal domain-containing protein [Fimicolochytrium jonesii]|uniref:SNF2 family N-terminal domain-containing protein n=1 Tax=Fimicolochytrium jonesii TaxID=1396493 RepID=UPI0022FE51C5|nr:SNF2 family N-terminal domain-containing protein [Fimicolochytrium jonesii]KAI8823631.1 SNF2 family N-terminal domain-containing protein [Fimicolochytrium jonesii]